MYIHGGNIVQRSVILYIHITFAYIHGAVSFALSSPCSPLYPFSTYLAPPSCDRNCPPPSQVACKLTLFAPPFTQLSRPFQLPRTPTAQRLTTTTLGLLRSTMRNTPFPKSPLDAEEFHRVLSSTFLIRQTFHIVLHHHFRHSSRHSATA